MNEKGKKILEQIRYATISTVDENGAPWAAPVWYVFDDNFDIYWWSPLETQHSKNISANPNIYVTIFDSTLPEGEGVGLYLRAQASVISDEELSPAIERYNNSTNVFKLDRDNCTGSAPTRIYKAVTKEGWTNDGVAKDGFYIDKRVSL
ncbi:MAG TPA: pyridoxamine 5'-phosphate oxidase family protein [Candidatus Saccharibacteria bacterium]|nr:pyridoxamine 5'-phosphate oxidase family protein [Candidatus Saccharibacteria bacterium]